METLYQRCKDMPNPSPGLLNLFKKKGRARIWAYKSHYNASDFVTKKKTVEMPLHKLSLRLGRPDVFGYAKKKSKDGKSVLGRSFSGCDLKQHMFTGRKQGDICLVGIGTKARGTWFIDVTERVVEELNTVGACALSKAHCVLVNTSPKIRKCKYCGRKQKSRVEVKKRIIWEDV